MLPHNIRYELCTYKPTNIFAKSVRIDLWIFIGKHLVDLEILTKRISLYPSPSVSVSFGGELTSQISQVQGVDYKGHSHKLFLNSRTTLHVVAQQSAGTRKLHSVSCSFPYVSVPPDCLLVAKPSVTCEMLPSAFCVVMLNYLTSVCMLASFSSV